MIDFLRIKTEQVPQNASPLTHRKFPPHAVFCIPISDSQNSPKAQLGDQMPLSNLSPELIVLVSAEFCLSLALIGLCRGMVRMRLPSDITMCLPWRTTLKPAFSNAFDRPEMINGGNFRHR